MRDSPRSPRRGALACPDAMLFAHFGTSNSIQGFLTLQFFVCAAPLIPQLLVAHSQIGLERRLSDFFHFNSIPNLWTVAFAPRSSSLSPEGILQRVYSFLEYVPTELSLQPCYRIQRICHNRIPAPWELRPPIDSCLTSP